MDTARSKLHIPDKVSLVKGKFQQLVAASYIYIVHTRSPYFKLISLQETYNIKTHSLDGRPLPKRVANL